MQRAPPLVTRATVGRRAQATRMPPVASAGGAGDGGTVLCRPRAGPNSGVPRPSAAWRRADRENRTCPNSRQEYPRVGGQLGRHIESAGCSIFVRCPTPGGTTCRPTAMLGCGVSRRRWVSCRLIGAAVRAGLWGPATSAPPPGRRGRGCQRGDSLAKKQPHAVLREQQKEDDPSPRSLGSAVVMLSRGSSNQYRKCLPQKRLERPRSRVRTPCRSWSDR